MRIALLSSHALHERNWIASGMVEVLRKRGHDVLPLIPDRPRWARLRRSLRLATLVAREPQSTTYRHKATLRRGGQKIEAAGWRLLRRRGVDLEALAVRIERALPRPIDSILTIRKVGPDVVFWATLLHMDAWENDLIKAAKLEGVKVVCMPASFDTLTTKGAFLLRPDRLLVWGEESKHHAIEHHGFSPDQVIITGPPQWHVYEEVLV